MTKIDLALHGAPVRTPLAKAVHQIASLRQVDTLIVGPGVTDGQRASLDAAGAGAIIVAGCD